MSKFLTIKALLSRFTPIELIREIKKVFGTISFGDESALYQTYDELLNEENNPIHKDRAYMYHLALNINYCPESEAILRDMPQGRKEHFDRRIMPYLYYDLMSNGKHYDISKETVIKSGDFSLCNVRVPGAMSKQDCACILVMSFAVLNEKIIERYGELRSPDYIHGLKKTEN